MEYNREEAKELLYTHTETESLRKHALAVEACMAYYAEKFDEDVDKWRVVGLLHDMDYEKHPTAEEHPFVGVDILKEEGYPEEITRAILSHADYTGVTRETLMEKTLYAVDELAGFTVACALVRPNGISDMKVKSVKKKLKQSGFAAAVSREDIYEGAEDLGIELNEHIQNVINALQQVQEDLEL
ncbi:MAG: HDIG domain-containing protein [Candidatus Marinimicrobia bacterium]|nr:HDIG domain-containing protein [Candidatus Neomarinimicrobiota bacterium]